MEELVGSHKGQVCCLILLVSLCLVCPSSVAHQLAPAGVEGGIKTALGNNTCMPGYFGHGCAHKCPLECLRSCDLKGACLACSQPGLQLPDCSRSCSNGSFGPDCQQECLVCLQGDCHPVSGECNRCRVAGLTLPDCTTPCRPGTFGQDCQNRCPLPCGQNCHPESGECLLCSHGGGPDCRLSCAAMENQEVCRLYCPDKCRSWCHTVSGTCTRCAPGFKPLYCNETCSNGTFGSNCEEKCSDRCQNGQCHPQTGLCYGCQDGYVGQRCNGQCVPGFYGPDCLLPCPQMCVTGLCHFTTGSCIQCAAGYTGLQCSDLCPETKFGPDCKQDCPLSCRGRCEPVTGECWQCSAGFVGVFCNETCPTGTFGQDCLKACPLSCLNQSCDPQTGQCHGCQGLLRGHSCDEASSSQEQDHPVWVIVLSLILLLGLVSFLGFFVCKQCRRKTDRTRHTLAADVVLRKEEDFIDVNEEISRLSHEEETIAVDAAGARRFHSFRFTKGNIKSVGILSYPADMEKISPRQIRHQVASPWSEQESWLSSTQEAEILQEAEGQHCTDRMLEDRQVQDFMSCSIPDTDQQFPPDHVRQYDYRTNEDTSLQVHQSSHRIKNAGATERPDAVESRSVAPSEHHTVPKRDLEDIAPNQPEPRHGSGGCRETRMEAVATTECSQGRTSVFSAVSMGGPVPEAAENTPDKRATHSMQSANAINSADSLFGLNSTDFSREAGVVNIRSGTITESDGSRASKNKVSVLTSNADDVKEFTHQMYAEIKTSGGGVLQTSTFIRQTASCQSVQETDSHSVNEVAKSAPAPVAWGRNSSAEVLSLAELACAACERTAASDNKVRTTSVKTCFHEKTDSVAEMSRMACCSQTQAVTTGVSGAGRESLADQHPSSLLQEAEVDRKVSHSFTSVQIPALESSRRSAVKTEGGGQSVASRRTSDGFQVGSGGGGGSSSTAGVDEYDKRAHMKKVFGEMSRNALGEDEDEAAEDKIMVRSAQHSPRFGQKEMSPQRQVKSEVSLASEAKSSSGKVSVSQQVQQPVNSQVNGSASHQVDRSTSQQFSGHQRHVTQRPSRPPSDNPPSPKLIRCPTTRQVSPMYSHAATPLGTNPQGTTRLQPLPAPPREGHRVLRPTPRPPHSSSSIE